MSSAASKRGRANKRRGTRFEYIERDYQRERGYTSERQYGSYGVFDVWAVAADGSHILLIQVKSYTERCGSYRTDIERLRAIPGGEGVRRLLVIYGPIKRGVKTPRKEIWV